MAAWLKISVKRAVMRVREKTQEKKRERKCRTKTGLKVWRVKESARAYKRTYNDGEREKQEKREKESAEQKQV